MYWYLKIGNVVFDIDSQRPLLPTMSDQSFCLQADSESGLRAEHSPANVSDMKTMNRNDAVTNALPCHVRVIDVDEITVDTELIYEEPGLCVYIEKDNEQVRTFRAPYVAEHPLYAKSVCRRIVAKDNLFERRCKCKEAWIDIYYDPTFGIWENPNFSFWPLLQLENLLLDTGGLILHSCYLMYRGGAILFTAPSGTGKTTQGEIWKKVYGAEIINGDRALLQKKNGDWTAFGYPLHGSASECRNENYPIRAIVVVKQASMDHIQVLSSSEAMAALYEGIIVNAWDKGCSMRTIDLLQDVIANVPIIRLECTMNESAARVLHDFLYEKNDA